MKRFFVWILLVLLVSGGIFVSYKGGFVSVYAEALSLWDDLRIGFTDKQELLRENAGLAEKYENQVIKAGRYVRLRDENTRLKKLLDIKEDMEYTSVAARVISYGNDSDFKYLIADKGSESGIHEGICAVSEGGLVGLVSECGNGWSVIETLHSDKLKLSVTCRTNGKTYLLNGGEPELSYVQSSDGITPGGLLVSSGLSESVPKGIKTGKVRMVRETESGEYRVFVSPFADYKNISYILFLIL